MIKKEQSFETGRRKIFLRTFLPETTPRAIVQINHGMAEHSARYLQLAEKLVAKGFGVYLHDHPGHGQSVTHKKETGVIPAANGWEIMLDVIHSIHENIKNQHPASPLIMIGHSMGSLLTRHYLAKHHLSPAAVIISGTNFPDRFLLKSGIIVVRGFRFFYPANYRSKRLNQFFYRNFNKRIPNAETPFDWLSSNPKEVSKYINDPLCGFDMSLGFYTSLFKGSTQLLLAEKHFQLEKNLPYLIISGKDDPVGDFGEGPKKLYELMKKQNYAHTQLVLTEGRHELLHEKPEIRERFIQLITDFMEKIPGIN